MLCYQSAQIVKYKLSDFHSVSHLNIRRDIWLHFLPSGPSSLHLHVYICIMLNDYIARDTSHHYKHVGCTDKKLKLFFKLFTNNKQ